MNSLIRLFMTTHELRRNRIFLFWVLQISVDYFYALSIERSVGLENTLSSFSNIDYVKLFLRLSLWHKTPLALINTTLLLDTNLATHPLQIGTHNLFVHTLRTRYTTALLQSLFLRLLINSQSNQLGIWLKMLLVHSCNPTVHWQLNWCFLS